MATIAVDLENHVFMCILDGFLYNFFWQDKKECILLDFVFSRNVMVCFVIDLRCIIMHSKWPPYKVFILEFS